MSGRIKRLHRSSAIPRLDRRDPQGTVRNRVGVGHTVDHPRAAASAGVFEMGLFDQELAEVVTDEGLRYVLRRNPLRAEEVQSCREDKLQALRKKVQERNRYLTERPRARVEVALRQVQQQSETLKISKWVRSSAAGRELCLEVDEQALAEVSQLDGCYALKTDLTRKAARRETIHARYKDLSMVEWAFRTSKTVQLEMRPIHVRLAGRSSSCSAPIDLRRAST